MPSAVRTGRRHRQRRRLLGQRVRHQVASDQAPPRPVAAENARGVGAHHGFIRRLPVLAHQCRRRDEMAARGRVRGRGSTDHGRIEHRASRIRATVDPEHRRPRRHLVGRPPVGHDTVHRRDRDARQPPGGHRIGRDDDVSRADAVRAVGRPPARPVADHLGDVALQRDQRIETGRELARQRLHAVGGQRGHAEHEHADQQQGEGVGGDARVFEQHPRQEPVDHATEFTGDARVIQRRPQRGVVRGPPT